MLEKIGKYEIRLQLGRGGMGVVYEGFDPAIERRVAIKMLRTELIEEDQLGEYLARFGREAKSAGRLSHPHIVTIYEYGEEDGAPYIVMEYIAGHDLAADFKRGVRHALEDVVRMMVQLLSALAHAHENGIVHRDIKPANVLLLDDGSLKVVDFGIARIEESDSFTKSGVVIGTPSYMAPEQILGLPATAKSDIFSAGILLYQLLTGDRPFTGDEFSIKQKVLKMDPMPPSTLNPTLGPPWDAVVSRAMAKKPEARYDSARQFLEAIRSAATAEGRAGAEARRKAIEAEEHAQREAEARSQAAASRRAVDERLAEIEAARAKAEVEAREAVRREQEELRQEKERVARLEAEARARAQAAEDARRQEARRAEAAPKPAAPQPTRSGAPAAIAIGLAFVAGVSFWFWRQSAQEEAARLEAVRVEAEAKLRTEAGQRAKAEAQAREESARRSRLEAEVARKEAEAKRAAELAAKLKAEEEKARALALKKEEEEKRKAEVAAKKELEAKAKAEALAAAEVKRKAEEAARREAEEKARVAKAEAEEKTRLAKAEAEEKAKAEAQARRAAEEKARAEADSRKPGRVFRDCPTCPQMVVIPQGRFTMGSPSSEEETFSTEGPQHEVRIPGPFAFARTEVTVAQFRRFVRATGRTSTGCYVYDGSEFNLEAARSWENPGFSQADDHPVVCVNWQDAVAYVKWLAKETGKDYRLPSEAEWEYAARAGTRTARYWGSNPSEACAYANVADQAAKRQFSGLTIHDCDDGSVYTASVGSKRANAFGLHDMLGNVWEWTADCWNDSYNGAPSDGTAWRSGTCSRRVFRGGSWSYFPRGVRSAFRGRIGSANRHFNLGFRPARTLE